MKRLLALALLMAGLGLAALPSTAFAQSDEIQVYDGGLAPKGVFNLTLHNNLIAKGITTVPFPGGVTADQSFNGVPEWAYGVTNWFEAGLYLPLSTHDKNLGFGLNGFKLRALFAVPDGDKRKFVYGSNFERLRANIQVLHPALDAWMVTEGYGRTLSRPGLDLARRELAIVAQVAVQGAERQLHSHLRGALNAGVTPEVLEETLEIVRPLLGPRERALLASLWDRMRTS